MLQNAFDLLHNAFSMNFMFQIFAHPKLFWKYWNSCEIPKYVVLGRGKDVTSSSSEESGLLESGLHISGGIHRLALADFSISPQTSRTCSAWSEFSKLVQLWGVEQSSFELSSSSSEGTRFALLLANDTHKEQVTCYFELSFKNISFQLGERPDITYSKWQIPTPPPVINP